MVLRGQLRGRVGRRQEFFEMPPRKVSCGHFFFGPVFAFDKCMKRWDDPFLEILTFLGVVEDERFGLNWQRCVQQSSGRLAVLFGVLVMAGAVASSAEAAQVRIDRENDSLTLSLVKVHGAEYLPLASLAKAVGNSPKPLLTGRSYRIQLGKSSLSVTVGSPKVRMGKSVILLPFLVKVPFFQ